MTRKSRATTTGKVKKREINQEVDLDFMGSRDEPAESRTLASRQRIHQQVDDDISQFLDGGGKINEIEPNVTADPPQRPNYRYGQRPI